MKNLSEIKIEDLLSVLRDKYNRITKKQKIIFCAVVILSLTVWGVSKSLWEKYSTLKRAKEIVAEISKTQQNIFKSDKKYKKDIFKDQSLVNSLGISFKSSEDDMFTSSTRRRTKRPLILDTEDIDYNIGQSGDFYIENDAENGCVVLRYKKNTSKRTVYYAAFDSQELYCRGKECFRDTKNNTVNLCFDSGGCFQQKQTQTTERSCGNGKGTQTRECTPSCEGGSCKDWGECVCKKGFEWDGTTCKQSQTEKDCTANQCFNGIYCEDKELLTKNIKNGSCERHSVCQKNKGWLYTSWDCSCKENYCSLKEECLPYPGNKDKLNLSDKNNVCFDVSYQCQNNGKGWQAKAKKCECNAPGVFWNVKEGNAECSQCTKKPDNAIFTTSGKNQDACEWKCQDGFINRKNNCVKPNGQYLCARTDISTCTDYFSKSRKMKIDAKTTNEGQPCFVEDKDNILFYNKKPASCQICQCVANFK